MGSEPIVGCVPASHAAALEVRHGLSGVALVGKGMGIALVESGVASVRFLALPASSARSEVHRLWNERQRPAVLGAGADPPWPSAGRGAAQAVSECLKSAHRRKTVMCAGYLLPIATHRDGESMLWKLLGLQKLFDELFEDGWFTFDLPSNECFLHEELTPPTQG